MKETGLQYYNLERAGHLILVLLIGKTKQSERVHGESFDQTCGCTVPTCGPVV
jgi:hypothetical protein